MNKLIVTRNEATEELCFERPLPHIAVVSDSIRAQSDLAVMLKQAGYRRLYTDIAWRTDRYARPLPLWAVHRASVAAHRAFWASLHWLYIHHVIVARTPTGHMTRLRHLRPWPMKGRRYET